MTLSAQIDCWFQSGEHEEVIQAILDLPDTQRTDKLMGDLAVAYNNSGEYNKAILVLEEMRNHYSCTASWQYRMGYALYYSAMKTPEGSRKKIILAKACKAFLAALQLNPKEPIKQDCLEFLSWIREDLSSLESM